MQLATPTRTAAATRGNSAGPSHPRAESVIWAGAMAVLVGASVAGQHGSAPGAYLALDIAVGLVSIALTPLLARWPVPVAVILSALAAISPAATPPATLAVLLVARWRRLAIAAEVAAAGIAAHLIRGGWRPIHGLPYAWWTVLVCVAYAALVGWGTLIRANRSLIASLRERAEHAEAEQARRVAEARGAERARIAREMHDVLAHRLSLLAAYAGALSYRPDAPPEQLAGAAEVIRSGVHQALDELREVIGVLRDDDDPPGGMRASRPQPGIADLPRLIEESRAAGMRVELTDEARLTPRDAGTRDAGTRDAEAPDTDQQAADAPARPLPDGAGRTVYRVIQEGLTNARKHAPGESVRVTLRGAPGPGLDIDIVNRVAAARIGTTLPGTETGLIGLAERVDLAAGRLEHHAGGNTFALHAWLPWPDDAAGTP